MTTVDAARVAEPVAGVALGQRIAWGLSDTAVVTRRYLLRYVRVPALVVFSTIQPVIFVLLFRYVFGGAIPIRGVTYVDYLIPGIILQTSIFGSIGTAIGLAEDLAGGMIDRFRALPMARSAVLVGRVSADTVRNVVVVGLMVGIGYAVGFRFRAGPWNALAMVALAILVGLSFSFISAMIGLALREAEAVQSFGLIWMFPLTFASSAFVPVASMPGWLQVFAAHQPVTVFVNALRDLALGSGFMGHSTAHDVWSSLAWVAGIVAVFAPLAVRTYRRAS